MNNIEDFRDAIIAEIISKVECMEHEELVRELIHLKTKPVETMTTKQLLTLRQEQVETDVKKYGTKRY